MPYVTSFERLAKQEGKLELLLAQLESKFGTTPSPAIEQKLATATDEQILQWSKQILTAETIEQVFAIPTK